jgi:hypothetical protein
MRWTGIASGKAILVDYEQVSRKMLSRNLVEVIDHPEVPAFE